MIHLHICAMVKSRYIGDGHPAFNRNPYNGYINPYYWVDDHPLLYGNNGSLDPGTYVNTYNLRQHATSLKQTHHLNRCHPQMKSSAFQPSMFRCEVLVSGSVQ